MKVVDDGAIIRIFGDGLTVTDKITPGVYSIGFEQMLGFYLKTSVCRMPEDKIYGDLDKKVAKAMAGYKRSPRNFGVILSGEKGMSKSMFVNMLTNLAFNSGLPVILVNRCFKGLYGFIGQIDQEVVFIFDEFDKTFTSNNDSDYDRTSVQTGLLSVMDGMAGGPKKMFVITCNNISLVNEFFLNRPGRFHYHFNFTNPDPKSVNEYLADNLKEETKHLSKDILRLCGCVKLTYDVLRAVVSEVNNGYDIYETFRDLNITHSFAKTQYNVEVSTNSKKFPSYTFKTDCIGYNCWEWNCFKEVADRDFGINFNGRYPEYSEENNEFFIDPKLIEYGLQVTDSDISGVSSDKREKLLELKNLKITHIKCTPIHSRSERKFDVGMLV